MSARELVTGRRLVVAEAAVRVIAAKGMRGLTHRAVDAEAGLPEGSSSVLARTRAALLALTSRYVAARLTSDVVALAAELVAHDESEGEDTTWTQARVVALVQAWIAEPELMRARAELVLEAHRSPEVREVLSTSRAGLLEVVTHCLATPDQTRAQAVTAAIEGVLVAALSRPQAQRESYVEQTVGLLVTALTRAD